MTSEDTNPSALGTEDTKVDEEDEEGPMTMKSETNIEEGEPKESPATVTTDLIDLQSTQGQGWSTTPSEQLVPQPAL